jgi:predicted secreted hydrolase
MKRPYLYLILIVLGLTGLAWLALRPDEPPAQAQFAAPQIDTAGFARAEGPRPFNFPTDPGPHDDYQTEWWYYTGNLQTDEGRHFGYQLTFFRRALIPPTERQARASAWAADQVYLVHFALTDIEEERHRASERFARGAAGLAGAQANPYQVWLEDWQVEEVEPGVYRLRATQEGLALDLRLVDRKGPILQGEAGYSQKGPQPGNASYYYSQTRLETSGEVRLADEAYPVSGLSWMDHEFSTSALALNQVGWDWFALQLDDGSELMVFQIRQVDGGVDPFSSGAFIAPDGETYRLSRDDFEIDVGATWRSPRSGATYPARWTITVDQVGLRLEVEPYLADQELNVSYAYWEGAVGVQGERDGNPVSGTGYVELTGYAGSMQGEF